MPTATNRTLQHPQPNLVFLTQNEVFDGFALLSIIAVHIVEEETALTLATRQQTIHMPDVISQLQQLCLRLTVALTSLGQQLQVLLRVPQRHQSRSVLNGSGDLLVSPVPVFSIRYLINHVSPFHFFTFSLL